MHKLDLHGRVAVITGGSGGIGLACARRMLASGAEVALWDISQASLDDARQSLGHVSCHRVDISQEQSVQQAAQSTLEAHGRVDILVNSAGVSDGACEVSEYPLERWRRVIEINLVGTFLCSKTLVGGMRGNGYGRIVNVSSTAGKDGNAFASAYSAAKAGVIGFTKAMAKENVASDIRINCVTPAAIETAMLRNESEDKQKMSIGRIPLGRPGTAEEVANLICWLASEECSFSTGAIFDLSGGRSTY